MQTAVEPENVSADTILNNGGVICNGYVPHSEQPDTYMELYEYNGYVYAICLEGEQETPKVYKIGLKY